MLNKHLSQGTILILSMCFSVFVYEIKSIYCLKSYNIWIDFIEHQNVFITSLLINFNELIILHFDLVLLIAISVEVYLLHTCITMDFIHNFGEENILSK